MIKFNNKIQEFNYYIEKAKKLEDVDKFQFEECLKKAKEVYKDAKLESEKKLKK